MTANIIPLSDLDPPAAPTTDHVCICTDVPCTPTPTYPPLPLPVLKLIGRAVYRAADREWSELLISCVAAVRDYSSVRTAARACPDLLISGSRYAVADTRPSSDLLDESRRAAKLVGVGVAINRWPATHAHTALLAIADEVSGPSADHAPNLLAAINEGYEEGRSAGTAAITPPPTMNTTILRSAISDLVDNYGEEAAAQAVLISMAAALEGREL